MNNLDLVKYLVYRVPVPRGNEILIPSSLRAGSYDTVDYMFSIAAYSTKYIEPYRMVTIIERIRDFEGIAHFVNVIWKPTIRDVIEIVEESYIPDSTMDMFVESLRADVREGVLRRLANDTSSILTRMKRCILKNRDDV